METRATTKPLGVRGIGKGGTIPAATTIVNAVARTIDSKKTDISPIVVSALKPQRVFAPARRQASLNAIVLVSRVPALDPKSVLLSRVTTPALVNDASARPR